MNDLLTIREAAEELRYSPATIRRWISAGKLEHVRFSQRGVRVPRESVDRLWKTGNGHNIKDN